MSINLEKEIKILPEELFSAVLLEIRERKNSNIFKFIPKIWHRAFYEAKRKFPRWMAGFSGLFREGPYIHEITECFHEFIQDEQLSEITPTIHYIDYLIRNPQRLESGFKVTPAIQKVAKYICNKIQKY